jgi:phage-related protein
MSILQADSFKLGNVEFWANGYDVFVEDEGTIVPPFANPRLNVSAITGDHGAVATGTTYDPQEIVLRCVIQASDGDVETRLTNVWNALKAHHAANVEEALIVQAWSARTYNVRWSGVDFESEYQGGADFTLKFIATYPRI